MPMFSAGFGQEKGCFPRSQTLTDPIQHDLDVMPSRVTTVVEGSGKLDFGEYELELWDLRYNSLLHNHMRRMQSGHNNNGKSWLRDWLRPSCVPITIIVTLSMLIVAMALLDDSISRSHSKESRCDQCS
ncbi:uncharacterized protein [Panulirus ornatus]|uniref:uncharacterized protein isoform X2 n=1 Tax=Panulirus ornatus TaxID=150431 RepID=UPI003A8C0777